MYLIFDTLKDERFSKYVIIMKDRSLLYKYNLKRDRCDINMYWDDRKIDNDDRKRDRCDINMDRDDIKIDRDYM